MPRSADFERNHLLAALPDEEWERWLPLLEPVELPLGHVIYEPGVTLAHVYFPTSSIVSLLYVMENGASAEIAVVGNEGIVGVSLFMGGESTPSRAVVQSAGQGFRLESAVMMREFNRAVPSCTCCCATPRRCSPRWRRRRSAIATTRWTNSCAAGCC